MATHDTTVSGVVASVNDKGLRLAGHTDWMNVSKFAVGVTLPERGATVTVTLDRAGFLRAVVPADGTVVPRIAGGSDFITQSATAGTRDRTITRLAILKAAAEFAAARPALLSADVVSIARSWEVWVNSEVAPSRAADDDDLEDTF